MTPRRLFAVLVCLLAPILTFAQEPIQFTTETLDNGLKVIYVPLHNAPVVHVRVIYHVGSRDERPDRQGFAHMFEHMMFRGSAHVKPEEHMKLIGMVGGISNAFTSFDQTVYHETLPSNQLQMALWLEADRMSSFKVSPDIYKTERQVVAEEWRMGRNRPYGTMIEEFLKAAFTTHSYRWTPIGDMGDLQRAAPSELQEFFNKYYIPNNATLVIAGDIHDDQVKKWVHDYFGWIPKGAPVERNIPAEPPQTKERDAVSPQHVPLPAIVIGYKTPDYKSDDHYALSLLSTILGDGQSSRLDRLLVQGQNPPCVNVGSEDMTLEDAGVFIIETRVKQGRNPEEVTQEIKKALGEVREKGITEDELKKAKTQVKVALIRGRQTAEQLASQVGEEAVFGGDPNRVNTELAKIEAVTPEQVKAVADKYLTPEELTDLLVKPDPLGVAARAAATQAAETKNAPVAASTEPIKPRVINFPADYPTTPPMAKAAATPEFKKGTDFKVQGVHVIVMTDNRLPLVTWSLTMRRGSNSEAKEKKGLNGIVAEMLTHGTKEQTYEELNNDLESKGISIGVNDGGDFTRLTGSSTTEQLEHGIERSHQILLEPRWDPGEFSTVKDQEVNNLLAAEESPNPVATHDLNAALYAGSLFAWHATPKTVQSITLDDVKQFYATYYKPNDALLVIAGDVTDERGKELAQKLLAGWEPAKELPSPDYTLPPAPAKRQIILVDRPDAAGVTIRMGICAYDIHSEDKFAGSLAGQVLTGSGIDSRLMKYVRAEKGLVYGIGGYFVPTRHNGVFMVNTETRPDAAAETITAAFHVLDGMRQANATEQELTESKLRVAGSMVMGMQTIEQQAGTRTDGVLNGYPIDYYDKYPSRIAEVSGDQVREVMNKYVKPDDFTIVVVAPAKAVKDALEKLGPVEVRPMPALREGAASRPSREMLK